MGCGDACPVFPGKRYEEWVLADPAGTRSNARTLKAIADPARLRLLSIIAARDGGEACVCDLTEPLGLTQPAVSHHLKVLVDAGLLIRDKRGIWAYFTLVPGVLNSLADVLDTRLAGAR